MKCKILYGLTAAALLVVCVVFTLLGRDTPPLRYHQHLEQPGEAELGSCDVCAGEGGLCTHLPILRIDTGGQKIPGAAILDEMDNVLAYEKGTNGEELIPVSLDTVETQGIWHHPEDPSDLSAAALFRYRGNSSRLFSKHSFLIKLVQEDDHLIDRDLPLLGMDADHEWALHGPFLDKTLLRNYMWMNVSALVMGDAPEVRFCELILDGEYQGVYVLMETITQGDARVNLTDYTPGDPVCSYMVRIGSLLNPLKSIDTFNEYTLRMDEGKGMEVLYPTTRNQTQEVHDYIATDLNEIERLLYSVHMNDRSRLYERELDVESFVDYYILQEFLAINDAFANSTYFYRDVRGKLHIGPVWDYNNALDNFFAPMDMEEFILAQRGWYGQLMQDEEFVEQVIDRYRELRRGVLSEDYLNAYLDETIAWLGSAVDRNFQVWGYTFDPFDARLNRLEIRQPLRAERKELERLDPENADAIVEQWIRELNPASYSQAVEQMRTAMNDRGAWMDRHIESLRQYCAESKNATKIIQ